MRYVDAVRWQATAGRVKDTGAEARQLNIYLDTLTSQVYKQEREMIQDGKAITFESFREKWLGITDRPRILMEAFQQHNDQPAMLVGKDFSPSTLERYKTSRDHTRSFLQRKYRVIDIDIKKLDYEFVSDFEFWLKTQLNCNHNTTIKYISNFRKIVNICIRKGWLQNGVPIESVSKMLGHKNLKTIQHYANNLDLKVSGDMKILKDKFGNQ